MGLRKPSDENLRRLSDVAPMNRRMKYRRAERTFRYPIYVTMEWLWVIVVLIGIGNEFRPISGDLFVVMALTALAIAHSITMTMVHPWIALKSILLGVVAFGLFALCRYYFGYPTSPLVIATIIASAHYLWTGEQWTTAKAR